MPKMITEAQEKLIRQLAEETGTTLYEIPKTQWGAAKKIDRLMRLKRNPRTNRWKKAL
jgi:hypothetical protein